MLHALGEGDLLAMHRTRVASRRLREILPVLELEAGVAARLGRRLKTVTVELGGVRELGVLANLAAELQDSGQFDPQAMRRIRTALVDGHIAARERLFTRLPVADIERIARKLAKVGRGLRNEKPSRAWQWAIDARVNRRAATLLEALDAAGSIYLQERLHDVRIALKKFRYSMEISCEASGLKPSPHIKTLKKYQDTLGNLHDRQLLIDRIRELQASIVPTEAAMWRKIDKVIAALEDDCRRLHAKFMRQRPDMHAIAERAVRATSAPGAAPRARAS